MGAYLATNQIKQQKEVNAVGVFDEQAKNNDLKVSKTLKALRQEKQLNMAELSNCLAAAKTFVSKYENKNLRLDLAQFLFICAALAIDPVEFIRQILQDNTPTLDMVAYTDEGQKCCADLTKNSNFKETTKDMLYELQTHMRLVRKAYKIDGEHSKQLTMRALGDMLGTPHSFIGKIETVARRLSVGEFLIMCDVMNVSAAEVLLDMIDVVNGH
jgi:transcriptional regulator with XRE-family HTH domain